MPYQSNLAELATRLQTARDAALIAAAEIVKAEVKRRLKGGYTTGDFVTGAVLNSVNITEPASDGPTRYILIGTSISDPAYPLFWEIGHQNRFTRKFEHVPIWVPSLEETQPQQFAAAVRAAQLSWTKSAPPSAPPVSEAAD